MWCQRRRHGRIAGAPCQIQMEDEEDALEEAACGLCAAAAAAAGTAGGGIGLCLGFGLPAFMAEDF